MPWIWPIVRSVVPWIGRRLGIGGVARAAGARAGAARAVGAAAFRRGATGTAIRGGGASTGERIGVATTALWGLQAFTGLLQSGSDSVLPGFTHAISVSVVGGPGADLRRCWYLCLSAALGRYRNRAEVGIQMSSLKATWDITGKACSVVIGYRLNQWAAWANEKLFPGRLGRSGYSLLHEGPVQATIGGNWADFLNVGRRPLIFTSGTSLLPLVGGLTAAISPPSPFSSSFTVPGGLAVTIPCGASSYNVYPLLDPSTINAGALAELATIVSAASIVVAWRGLGWRIGWDAGKAAILVSFDGLIPSLPDDGRVITTSEKNDPRIQQPKPPGDGISRGGVLSLVAQSLQEPCFCVAPPMCVGTNQPVVTLDPTTYVYQPGARLSLSALQNAVTVWTTGPTIYNSSAPGTTLSGPPTLRPYLGPDGQILPPLSGVTRGQCGEPDESPGMISELSTARPV